MRGVAGPTARRTGRRCRGEEGRGEQDGGEAGEGSTWSAGSAHTASGSGARSRCSGPTLSPSARRVKARPHLDSTLGTGGVISTAARPAWLRLRSSASVNVGFFDGPAGQGAGEAYASWWAPRSSKPLRPRTSVWEVRF